MFERNIKKFTKLKSRTFFLLLVFILVSTALIWLFNSPQPHLRSIVSKTQLHIKNINSKLQVIDTDETLSKNLEVDSTYLELLGFVKEPNLFKENIDASTNDPNLQNDLTSLSNKPPIVTAFFRFTEKEKTLIESKLKHFLTLPMLIYDLDLSSSEQLKIKKLCNSSCTLKPFKGDKYPRHLVNPKMKAYKPIILQEVLNENGALIWIETPNVFTSNKIEKYLAKAKSNGVLTWQLKQPVSQLTHPLMFKYFNSKADDFYFVHTLDTSQLILYNSQLVHESLMLPWVKCALKEECIAPPGSKYFGCDFDRKPLFHYSGCHRYEMSAFSIITSLLFKFDYDKYTVEYENGESGASSSVSSVSRSKVTSDDVFFVNWSVYQATLTKQQELLNNENLVLNEITTKN